MNHTTNLHLPQWEETDRIQMDDFNDAFDKIDTAVGNAARLVKLKEVALPSPSTTFSVALNDIDWDKWQYVHIDVVLYSLEIDGHGQNSSDFCLNSLQDGGKSIKSEAITVTENCIGSVKMNLPNMSTTYRHRFSFIVCQDKDSFVHGSYSGSGMSGVFYHDTLTYQALTQFSTESFLLTTASRATVWGER